MAEITMTKGKLANILSSTYPVWLKNIPKSSVEGLSPYGQAAKFIKEELSDNEKEKETP